MLTAVKNQLRVIRLSIKYALMRSMLNKVTFFSNIIFMILNNASFIIQWVVLFALKEDIGGYTFKQVLLLWGLAASTYGFSRFFFKRAFDLSETINNGKLDVYLVQPKDVLISAITMDIEPSALGDMIYGYIMFFIYGFSISGFSLFTLFTICGGLMVTAIAVILGSLSFWFQKSDVVADTGNSLMVNFATYPDGIFKGLAKVFLYTIVPVGFVNYIPLHILSEFNIYLLIVVVCITSLFVLLAFIIFNTGLKKYSSSNLMIARI